MLAFSFQAIFVPDNCERNGTDPPKAKINNLKQILCLGGFFYLRLSLGFQCPSYMLSFIDIFLKKLLQFFWFFF